MLQRVSTAALVLALCLGTGAQTGLNADMQKAIAAIKAGNVAELERLLKNRPELVTAFDPKYNATLLHWAAALKDAKAVGLLIEHKAFLGATNKEGATPLQLAIVPNPGKPGGADSLDLVKKLATPEVVKIANVDGKTALHLACQYDQLETARYLIREMGADLNARTKTGKRPLDYVPEPKSSAIVELLKAEEAWLNTPPVQPPPTPLPTPTPAADSSVALRDAAADGDLEAVKRILRKNKGWINSRNESDETPLHMAAKNYRLDVIAELINQGADAKLKDKQGRPFWVLLCPPPPAK